MIFIVDFGSQTTHLIKRRIKDWGVLVRIVQPEDIMKHNVKQKPAGIILSGGPASVYEKNAPTIDSRILSHGIPLFGICYGLQLIVHMLGGTVRKGKIKESGPATLSLTRPSSFFMPSFPHSFQVWMSHGDEVVTLPDGFSGIGSTATIPFAAISHDIKKIWGVQFHPEVIHTHYGDDIIKNFLRLCGERVKKRRINQTDVDTLVQGIADVIHSQKAICALSGGIDSSVAALISHRAIGQNLTACYIDSGLMRQGETESLKKIFKKHYKMKIKVISAHRVFLHALAGIADPEKKRHVIGRTFISVLEREARKLEARFLIQGTIYPDVIESAGTKHSDKIKSHHNVSGLPKKMKLTLVEPLRTLYKDEVRQIGRLIHLPDEIIYRQPFPGPGIAIRIIGSVTDR